MAEGPTDHQLQQEQKLLSDLKTAGIPTQVYRHGKIMTMEPLLSELKFFNGTVCKNLVFKDKKGALFLVTSRHDSGASIKALSAALGSGGLRMADEKLLEECLDVIPGCVTPLAILNNKQKNVNLVLDDRLKEDVQVCVHPLHNFASVELNSRDLVKFIEERGHAIQWLNFEQLAAPVEVAAKVRVAKAQVGASSEVADASLLGITVGKTANFSEWYTQVIVRGELVDYYDISGCYIIRPWSFKIWEVVQKAFDDAIKDMGVENCYFPMFVSKAKLEKEKDHVEGFSPEVAWVTHYGDTPLAEKVAIRPTSETIMYPAFARWIRSHRDLPLKLNQWCSVVRWEFKQPTPFLRTREFLWQEGHTAHATEEEAVALVLDILELYRQWYEVYLAVPVIKGEKSQKEKFAGGKMTTTLEGFLPTNGRAIQAATSHLLGQNFAKMFEIEFENEKGVKEFAHQTSWGCTTRSLGIMVMTHGDDKGLVLPPKVAGVQVIIIPIFFKDEDTKELLDKCHDIKKALNNSGIRSKVDDRCNYTPGWKYNHWEVKGVPVRMEVGPRDLKNGTVRIVRRDTYEAYNQTAEGIAAHTHTLLDLIQADLFKSAKAKYDESIEQISTFAEVMPVLNRKHLVLAPWCEDPETEEKIKLETARLSELQSKDCASADAMTGSMKSLCLPFEQPPMPQGTKCFWSGKPAKRWCLFGRSY